VHFRRPRNGELAALGPRGADCGRYEAWTSRIQSLYCDLELSIGDYVLSGGELAADRGVDLRQCRLIPGVLATRRLEVESFGVADAEIATAARWRSALTATARGGCSLSHYTVRRKFAGLRVRASSMPTIGDPRRRATVSLNRQATSPTIQLRTSKAAHPARKTASCWRRSGGLIIPDMDYPLANPDGTWIRRQ